MIKKILQITIILICFTANSQETIEGKVLVQEITKALKNQNETLIINCTPNKAELQELIKLTVKNASSEFVPTIETIQNSITSEVLRTFQVTLDSGEINEIIWNEISLNEFEIEKEMFEFEEIEKSDIYINYSYKETTFRIKLVDCVKIDGKWNLMDRIWWLGVEVQSPNMKSDSETEEKKE